MCIRDSDRSEDEVIKLLIVHGDLLIDRAEKLGEKLCDTVRATHLGKLLGGR